MRSRLLRRFVVVALFAVAVLGIPLGLIGRMLVRQDANRRADREADTVGFAVQRYLEAGQQVPATALASFVSRNRVILLTDAQGNTVTFGTPSTDNVVEASITLGRGEQVVLRVPGDDVERRRLYVVLLVAAISAASVSMAAVLGALLARRLSHPLDDLASISSRLGDGDFTVRAAHTGLAEIDAVADALNSCAERIGTMVMSERQFSANASHQLRSPLTALRMRFEEISEIGTDEVRAEAQRGLEQADRLNATIDSLLRLAREGSLQRPGPIDFADIVRLHSTDWRQVCDGANRRLVVELPERCAAVATVGGASQVVQTLIENSVQHGRGTIRVTVFSDRVSAVVQVSDEGAGIAAEDREAIFDRHVSQNVGHGVGLALARALAAADGGHLDVVQLKPPIFQLRYPAPERGPSTLASSRPVSSSSG